MPVKKTEIFEIPDKAGLDIFASTLSNKYLVWKDSNGNVGIGDTQYPFVEKLSVFGEGEWADVSRLPNEKQGKHQKTDEQDYKSQKTPEELAAKFGMKYLVWRDKDGNIGFGDTIYPDRGKLTIYDEGQWNTVEKLFTEKKDNAISETLSESDTNNPEKYSGKYLVWKDKDGNIGFGDTSYPNKTKLKICDNGKWHAIKRIVSETRKAYMSKDVIAEFEAKSENVESKFGEQYLMWKDKDGNIGFGDTGYPDERQLLIYGQGKWVSRGNTYAGKIERNTTETSPPEKKLNSVDVATTFSGKYLVWKDKDGNVGYGNIQYPEIGNISHICINGTWQKIVN